MQNLWQVRNIGLLYRLDVNVKLGLRNEPNNLSRGNTSTLKVVIFFMDTEVICIIIFNSVYHFRRIRQGRVSSLKGKRQFVQDREDIFSRWLKL